MTPVGRRLEAAGVPLVLVAGVIGVVGLVGWATGVEVLTQGVPGRPALKPNAAVCLVLSSVALLGYRGSARGSWRRRLASGVATLVMVVGLLTLAEYVLGWRLGIDELLVRDARPSAPRFPGRMAANAALAFALLGAALLAWDVRARTWWVSHGLALAAAALGALALVGYATRASQLIDIAAGQQIAVPAAIGVVLVALGVLGSRPDRGVIALVASGGHGGVLLRRLLPVAILLPVTLAALSAEGEALGLYGARVGAWLVATAGTLGLVSGAVLLARQVEDRDAERARAEAAFRAVSETAADAIVTATTDGTITYVNRAAEELFDYASAELVGAPLAWLFADPDAERALAGGEAVVELTGQRRGGLRFALEVSRSRWSADEHPEVTLISRDISARRHAEQQLRGLSDAAPDAIVISDELDTIVLVNARAEMLFGYEHGRLVGAPIWLLIPTGLHAGPQARGRRQDGSEFPVEITLNQVPTDDGTMTSCAIRDVTDRRRAEEALARFAATADASADAIVGVTPNGTIDTWNGGAQRLYGYPPHEAIGRPLRMLVPPERWDERRETVERVLGGESVEQFDTEDLRADDRRVEVAISKTPIRNRLGQVIGAARVARDITERKRAERELERLAAAAEHGTDAVISVDLEGRIRHWNRGAERLYGWSAEEAVARSLNELTVLTDEPREQMQRLLAGEPAYQYDTQRRRKDGSLIDVRLTISPWRERGQLVGATGIAIDLTQQHRRERELAALETRWRAAARNLPGAALVIFDEQLRYVEADGAALRELGLDPADLVGQRVGAVVDQPTATRVACACRRALAGEPSEVDYETRGRILHGRVVGLDLNDGRRRGMMLSVDVTERRRAEDRLRRSEQRLRILFEGAPIGVALAEPHEPWRLLQANPALGEILSLDPASIVGLGPLDFINDAEHHHVCSALEPLLGGQTDRITIETRLTHTANQPRWVSLSISIVRATDGAPLHLVVQVQDVSERKRFEGRLQYLADHDPLTGLYNRRRFAEELGRARALVERYQQPASLLVIDLDEFKTVNDRHGHAIGDELLGCVASSLRGRLRDTDVIGRLGGDEFAAILPHTDTTRATLVAHDITQALSAATVPTPTGPVSAAVSVGIAPILPGATDTADDVLVAADLAMYEAKQHGRNRVALARTNTDPTPQGRRPPRWSQRIEHALEHDRFELVRQPIAHVATQQIERYELLLRMRDDNDHLIPPGVFLHIAEQTGQIRSIDQWVIANVARILAHTKHIHPSQVLEVNLSGATLTDPATIDAIIHNVASADIDPTKLVLELTETAAIVNVQRARALAKRLAALGCQLALDDFGAGFGSFYYLKHLPFDTLKIDGDFIRNLPTSPQDQLTVRAIVHIAHGLGKTTIAEYVQDAPTLRLLAHLGVDYAQGHHIGHPEPLPPPGRPHPTPPPLPNSSGFAARSDIDKSTPPPSGHIDVARPRG